LDIDVPESLLQNVVSLSGASDLSPIVGPMGVRILHATVPIVEEVVMVGLILINLREGCVVVSLATSGVLAWAPSVGNDVADVIGYVVCGSP